MPKGGKKRWLRRDEFTRLVSEQGRKKGWLADNAGISEAHLRSIAKGAACSLPVAKALASLLGVNEAELFTEAGA